jgi:DNA polymerase-3 subunit epsilon
MLNRWRFERRLNSLANSDHAVLRDYASADWPDLGMATSEARFLALDFELDGLRKDAHLLQAGWAPFEGHSIRLAGAHSVDIRSTANLDAEAVTIHGIGEQRAAKGEPLGEVILDLVRALSGRVLVAHAAGIERTALQRATRKLLGVHLPVRCVCTLTLERALHPNQVGSEPYRLGSCRKRYGLPDYRAHDALTDALAAAELFQAQLTRLPDDASLRRVVHG